MVVRGLISFVGREAEQAALGEALADVMRGQGGIWLLSGEAGIGKSRLAEEVARDAADREFTVVWGRCWEAGGAPAFWPWLQALRSLVRTHGTKVFSPYVARVLAPLVPELQRDEQAQANSEHERFMLLDAMGTALCEAASTHPLLVVLDDLHAADPSTLTLLDFVSRQLRSSRVLVLGTYRPREAQSSGELFARIAQDARTLALGPLDQRAVQTYLQQAGSLEGGDERLAKTLYAKSEGHPLFMVELARLLVQYPHATVETLEHRSLPPGLEQALADRVKCLSDQQRPIIEMAAIMGREFSGLALASYFENLAPEAVRSVLEELVAMEVLCVVGADTYRFTHILLRDAIERGLDELRRHALHNRLATSLASADHPPWSEVAHHLIQAGVEHKEEAIGALVKAAESAIGKLAYEDGVASYERALELACEAPEGRDCENGTYAQVLLGLCRACLLTGQTEEGQRHGHAVIKLASSLSDHELFAKAALELGTVLVFSQVDTQLVALLKEALDRLPSEDAPLRALVQARLAAAMQPSSNPTEPIKLAQEAIAMARRLGDKPTMLATLRSGCSAMVDLAPPEVRMPLDLEHAKLAQEAGEHRDALRAEMRLIFDCFEMADRLGADAHVRTAKSLIRESDHPGVTWRLHAMEAMRLLWDGALEAALESCRHAAEIGVPSGDPNARTATVCQSQRILRMLGRHEEMVAGIEEMRTLFFGTPAMRQYLMAFLAAQFLEVGERESALQILEDADLEGLIQMGDRTILEPLAEIALATSDKVLAAQICKRLEGCEEQFVCGGVLGMTWDAPVHRPLALCCQALGEFDAAIDHFRRGIEAARRMGGEPVATWMRGELGALLLAQGDPQEGRKHLQEAIRSATTMSMRTVVKRCETALEVGKPQKAPQEETTEAPTTSTSSKLTVEPEGDIWQLTYKNQCYRMKHTKGLQFLAELTARPRQPVHVLELVAPAQQPQEGDGGELFDEKAKLAYKEKIASLRAQLSEAEEWNDSARAEAISNELETLLAHLQSGLGLSGRGRRFSGNAERARVNVQRRIRDVIKRVHVLDEGLGRHLQRSVRTGMHCVYDPE
jgi:tetratricopeptide (TPR) repeat protein